MSTVDSAARFDKQGILLAVVGKIKLSIFVITFPESTIVKPGIVDRFPKIFALPETKVNVTFPEVFHK